MERKRILILVAKADLYGAENALTDTLRVLPTIFEPIVFVPQAGALTDSLAGLGIRCEIVPFPILDRKYFHPLKFLLYAARALASTSRIVKLTRSLKIQIVHTNNVLILPGAFSAKLLGVPHVWHVREIIEGYHIHPRLWKVWRATILGLSDRVICISSAVKAQFGGSPKATTIHDGIDADLFQPIGSGRPETTRSDSNLTVATVGRLDHRRKGQDTFIEAARIVIGRRQDLKFLIVGKARDGMEERERPLYDLVNRYGLKSAVDFRGEIPRERMPAFMNSIDVLVVCSKQPEGLGIVLLEAMSAQKAVISFAEGGPLDILSNRCNGLLVSPQDAESLAQAIVELAENPTLRKSLGVEGRKTVLGWFKSEDAAKRIAELYEEILAKPNASRK